MTYWRLRVDDPKFHLTKGDVLEGTPFWVDPGGILNPGGRVQITCRVRDNYFPECSIVWSHLDELPADSSLVKRALLEGASQVGEPVAAHSKPRLVVLAASAVRAQREIRELRLTDLFVPHYIGIPHALAGGVQQFIVLDSFIERRMSERETEEWADMLMHLRELPYVREFTPDEVRRVAQSLPG